jgi:hypothetical protein
MTLFVVGNIDVESTTKDIHDLFGTKSHPVTENITVPLDPNTKPTNFNINTENIIKIYQHELIPEVTITFNKLDTLKPLITMKDVYEDMIMSIIEIAFESRVFKLENSMSSVPFTFMNWGYYESSRENAFVQTFNGKKVK